MVDSNISGYEAVIADLESIMVNLIQSDGWGIFLTLVIFFGGIRLIRSIK